VQSVGITHYYYVCLCSEGQDSPPNNKQQNTVCGLDNGKIRKGVCCNLCVQ
jgi:hypothetical protein